VGSFVGDAWREWNGRFRDDVRAFFRGEDGVVGRFADRIIGSPDMYAHEHREPEQSVNFVTCHDGFTLNDLVSYNDKHNEANLESNRDGGNDNRAWNCGVEGPTDDPAVERLRNRQVKNFLTTTLLAVGMPMILMGDEMRRTQEGNNNLYCHDDARAWLDWTLLDRHRDVHRFVSLLNARRAQRTLGHEAQRLSLAQLIARANRAWHGVRLNEPDWGTSSHSLAFGVELQAYRSLVHFIFNAYWEPLDFELPLADTPRRGPWRRWIDTALDSPLDIVPWESAPVVDAARYRAESRSVVVLFAALGPETPGRTIPTG
jgi:glycogen operon protein